MPPQDAITMLRELGEDEAAAALEEELEEGSKMFGGPALPGSLSRTAPGSTPPMPSTTSLRPLRALTCSLSVTQATSSPTLPSRTPASSSRSTACA
ncbi:MAG TPA: hypothetical protein VJ183_19140 [Chloroflexia bacterium]|nr:hypothetical protein [Chloroflexia bacterium]